MSFQPSLLDTGITERGLARSKIDLTTPVNIYTSLQANQRANRSNAIQNRLSELTLTETQKKIKRQEDYKAAMQKSLNPDGRVNGELAIQNLNEAGLFEEANSIADRMAKAQVAQRQRLDWENKKRVQSDLETAKSFQAVLDSENPVDAFMIAREDAARRGVKLSPGLLNYMPTDEEIQEGRIFDSRVRTELQFLADKAVAPKGPMSLEEKLFLQKELYDRKKELIDKKQSALADEPITPKQKKELLIKSRDLYLKGKKEERENEKWMKQINDERRKKGQKKVVQDTAYNTVVQDLGRGMEVLEKNMNNGIIPTTAAGPIAYFTKLIPGTDADVLEKFAESVKSNISIDQLQKMRENSPTGGALGQVPVQQQEYLMQLLGSLSVTQKPGVLHDNMKRIYNIYMDMIHGVANGPPRKRLSFNNEGVTVEGGVPWTGTEYSEEIESTPQDDANNLTDDDMEGF